MADTLSDSTTLAVAEPLATTEASPSSNIISLRAPSKYLRDPTIASTTTAGEPFAAPSNEWLCHTWAVTHSTLSMWRSSRNVRITYSPASGEAPAVNDNIVEYEKGNGKGGVKSVLGIERPDPSIPAAWNWRGRGWLVIASSHWEILGWGERSLPGGEGIERWAVTWFAPTLFTEEGVDIYSERKEGLSKETADEIIAMLKKLDAPKLVQLVEKKMMEVAIELPWKESK